MASVKPWIAGLLGALALGVAVGLAGSRPRRRLGDIIDAQRDHDLSPIQLFDIEARARASGANGKLTYIGAGAEGYVTCDEHGKAFKAAWPGRTGLKDEAKWFQMAAKIPSIKQHVPKFADYNDEERVLVRECLIPRKQGPAPNSKKLYELHKRLVETMAPYGFGRPEFKVDAYVYTKRGPVLVDAGFAVNRGKQLVKEALAVLKQSDISKRDAEDLAFALRMERGETIPAPIANKLLTRLKARDPAVELSGEKPVFEKYKRAKTTVDDRIIRDDVPNTSSISSSVDNYEVVPGIREIPFSAFDQMGPLRYYSTSEEKRTKKLAEQIRQSNEISPLIVVEDAEGPYILEGAHRFDALRELDAKSFPALVVLDLNSLKD